MCRHHDSTFAHIRKLLLRIPSDTFHAKPHRQDGVLVVWIDYSTFSMLMVYSCTSFTRKIAVCVTNGAIVSWIDNCTICALRVCVVGGTLSQVL